MNRAELIKLIQKKFPSLILRTTEEFDGETDGVWVTGDLGTVNSKGKKLFDHYCTLKSHRVGVRVDLHNLLEKNGWYPQWADAGTVMLWKV